jgi:D-lactate dehydrogenase
MKIAFYEINDKDSSYIKEQLPDHELRFFPGKFSDDALPESDIEILSMFTGSPVTPKVISSLPGLKLVATRTTGFDHINLEACTEKNIVVSNVPAYGQNTVAELAFALILTISRKLYPAIKRVREQGLFSFEGFQGFDLAGKTLGVIGTGHIGEYVIKIAKGFGMEVIAYDPFPNQKMAEQYGFSYASLEEVLAQADITTLHVPYMPATHHLINKDNIMKMKRGSVLINTSRGGLIDTEALVMALRAGVLSGAGLDVLEEEGFVIDELNILSKGHPQQEQLKTVLADHELMQMDNVIISPHMGAQTTEALRRILITSIDNIKQFIAGTPSNVVKPK